MQGTHSLSRDGHMQEADGQGPGAVPLRRRWGEEPGGDVPYWSVVRTLKAGAGGDASHSGGQAPGLGRRTGGGWERPWPPSSTTCHSGPRKSGGPGQGPPPPEEAGGGCGTGCAHGCFWFPSPRHRVTADCTSQPPGPLGRPGVQTPDTLRRSPESHSPSVGTGRCPGGQA